MVGTRAVLIFPKIIHFGIHMRVPLVLYHTGWRLVRVKMTKPFQIIETEFQVQTMILAVSGSTANTADPLGGSGVTPVYAGLQIQNSQIHVAGPGINKHTNTC